MTSTGVMVGVDGGADGAGVCIGAGALGCAGIWVLGRLLTAADSGTVRAVPALLAAPDTDSFFVGRFCLLLITVTAYHTPKADSRALDLWGVAKKMDMG